MDPGRGRRFTKVGTGYPGSKHDTNLCLSPAEAVFEPLEITDAFLAGGHRHGSLELLVSSSHSGVKRVMASPEVDANVKRR
jgi:hypothetical protein